MVVPDGNSCIQERRQDDVAYGPGGRSGRFVGDPCAHNFSRYLESTHADILWL